MKQQTKEPKVEALLVALEAAQDRVTGYSSEGGYVADRMLELHAKRAHARSAVLAEFDAMALVVEAAKAWLRVSEEEDHVKCRAWMDETDPCTCGYRERSRAARAALDAALRAVEESK